MRRAVIGIGLLAASGLPALPALPPVATAAGTISRCSAPDGVLLFTDRGCPEGYELVLETDARPRRAGPEPLFTPAAPEPPPPPRPRKPTPTPAPCWNGSFRTVNSMTSFAVFFTNQDSAPCEGVRGYCLFHMFTGGPGDYRESGTVQYRGVVGPGETVGLGTVSSSGGPPGRSIAWSWCRLR